LKDKKLKAFEWKSILKFLACEGEKAKAKVYRNRWLFLFQTIGKNLPTISKSKKTDSLRHKQKSKKYKRKTTEEDAFSPSV